MSQNREAREFNRKGVAALESGRYNDSIQLLKQAMVLEPTWAEPCFNAARLLKQLGKREDMTKMLRKANGLEPTNSKYTEEYLKVLYEDYLTAEKNSNYLERDKISQEIFRVSPGNLNLGLKLVENKMDSGNKDEALSLAEDILSKNTRQRSRYQIKEMGKLFYIVAQIAFVFVVCGTPRAVRVSGGHLCRRQKHRPNRQVRTFPTIGSAEKKGHTSVCPLILIVLYLFLFEELSDSLACSECNENCYRADKSNCIERRDLGHRTFVLRYHTDTGEDLYKGQK